MESTRDPSKIRRGTTPGSVVIYIDDAGKPHRALVVGENNTRVKERYPVLVLVTVIEANVAEGPAVHQAMLKSGVKHSDSRRMEPSRYMTVYEFLRLAHGRGAQEEGTEDGPDLKIVDRPEVLEKR